MRCRLLEVSRKRQTAHPFVFRSATRSDPQTITSTHPAHSQSHSPLHHDFSIRFRPSPCQFSCSGALCASRGSLGFGPLRTRLHPLVRLGLITQARPA